MKTTTKEYTDRYEQRAKANREIYAMEQLIRQGENTLQTDRVMDLAKELVELLDKVYFDKLDMVSVRFSIGGRNYYRTVAKIGSKYFEHGKSMTKGNGHYDLREIDAITDKMSEEMLSDSYYY